MKLHVLFITSKFPRYKNDPQPAFVFYMAKALVDLGHRVSVIAPHHYGAKLRENLSGVEIFRFRYFFPTRLQNVSYGAGIPSNLQRSIFSIFQMPFFVLSEILLSRKITRKIKPDIIHAHWGFPQGLAAKYSGIPYIVYFYGGEALLARKFHLSWLLDYIVKHSSGGYTATPGLARFLREFGMKEKVEAIALGADIERFKPKLSGYAELKKKYCPDGQALVLCVGRLVEKKGIRYLIEAMPEVLESVKCRLLIAGGGPLETELKELSSRLKLDGSVTFLGEVSHKDLPCYYSACDLFVLPSVIDRHGDREGQGVVYVEAMASGVPVIGTLTGGIADVVKPDVGICVKQKNPHALAVAIIKLLKNDSLRTKMGKRAYEYAQEFSWKKIAQKYLKVYSDILRS